jgi:hypothetical protein
MYKKEEAGSDDCSDKQMTSDIPMIALYPLDASNVRSKAASCHRLVSSKGLWATESRILPVERQLPISPLTTSRPSSALTGCHLHVALFLRGSYVASPATR